MKNVTKIALTAILAGISTTGYGLFSKKSAKASCTQNLAQMQNVECGNVAAGALNVNVIAPPKNDSRVQINFGPTICNVTANQTANQIAQCTAIAGKAGDILTFKPEQLPKTVGTDVFNLGTITARKDQNGIAAPKNDNGVILNFVTAEGLPISFLIRRQMMTLAELDALGTETQAAADYKNMLRAKFPKDGSPAILTVYYRQLRGMESRWTELRSDVDSPTAYQFSPKFNATVYPNGLVVLRTNLNPLAAPGQIRESKKLFPIGDATLNLTDKETPNPSQVSIGGGKFATIENV